MHFCLLYECVHSCRSNPVNPLQTFLGEIFSKKKEKGENHQKGNFPQSNSSLLFSQMEGRKAWRIELDNLSFGFFTFRRLGISWCEKIFLVFAANNMLSGSSYKVFTSNRFHTFSHLSLFWKVKPFHRR